MREIEITITGNLPLDALKAAANQVERTERDFSIRGVYNATTNKNGLKDVTLKDLLKTGASVFEIHSFKYTFVAATGKYTFAYEGTYPNAQAKIDEDAESESGGDEGGTE